MAIKLLLGCAKLSLSPCYDKVLFAFDERANNGFIYSASDDSGSVFNDRKAILKTGTRSQIGLPGRSPYAMNV
jgi:hypothetical protein